MLWVYKKRRTSLNIGPASFPDTISTPSRELSATEQSSAAVFRVGGVLHRSSEPTMFDEEEQRNTKQLFQSQRIPKDTEGEQEKDSSSSR